jgi:methionyl-tRNA formyltransferase
VSPSARIAFAGTPEFAVPALLALAGTGAAIPLVLTQPDRPAGRGRRLAATPVKLAAEDLGLSVLQPAALKRTGLLAELGPSPDLMIVVAYGLLLPQWLLEWPALGCINLHASLLPRWRGAAPIQYAILAGDDRTGVSVMQMDAGLDTGPVYLTRETPIAPSDTAGALHDRLALLGAAALTEALPAVLARRAHPAPQRADLATFAPKIDKAAARLDWRDGAAALERRVRAFNPWPIAESSLSDGRRLRIWEAEALGSGSPAQPPGTIIAAERDGVDVATGAGVLRLTRVQPPSGRVMNAAAYLAAHSLAGTAFVD